MTMSETYTLKPTLVNTEIFNAYHFIATLNHPVTLYWSPPGIEDAVLRIADDGKIYLNDIRLEPAPEHDRVFRGIIERHLKRKN